METKDNSYLQLEEKILKVLKEIYDPEIPVNIYDLGLIYEIDVDEYDNVDIKMTLTAPNCPVAESLPIEVRDRINAIEGVKKTNIEMTFDPPWAANMMSEEAKLMLGYL
ncbi:MAG: SUF system Fe-S cluster assembly protein [Bacteroidales bacterium]|nr:SUF system Fe-S cluster assembly protein [Bacteroidales bacterium]MBN2756089.1 SUF system Fe-S cluster assembly protein [Bacteroidales bacterium]